MSLRANPVFVNEVWTCKNGLGQVAYNVSACPDYRQEVALNWSQSGHERFSFAFQVILKNSRGVTKAEDKKRIYKSDKGKGDGWTRLWEGYIVDSSDVITINIWNM